MAVSAARPTAVLGVAGGIAAYKVAYVASGLVQRGVDVRVAMTSSSLSFVGPSTFGGLTGTQPILSSTQVDPDGAVPHIEAGRAAQVYCIAPATAGATAGAATGAWTCAIDCGNGFGMTLHYFLRWSSCSLGGDGSSKSRQILVGKERVDKY